MEEWLQECDFLAPVLKTRLENDEEHSWRDAPYIHSSVRKALEARRIATQAAPTGLNYANAWNPYAQMQTQLSEAYITQLQLQALTQQNQLLYMAQMSQCCLLDRRCWPAGK